MLINLLVSKNSYYYYIYNNYNYDYRVNSKF